MKNNRGFSLTEVLVTLAILGIVVGIGSVNFGGYNEQTQKQLLYQDARLWVRKVNNCLLNVSSMGGWKVITPDNTTIYPCKASNEPELKKVLDWECPEKTECKTEVTGSDLYCLNIKHPEKKYYVFAHFNIQKQTAKVYCGIKEDPPPDIECNATPSYASWNAGPKNPTNQCEWPIPSDPGPST